MRIVSGVLLLVLSAQLFAGSNKNAKLYIDCIASTSAIDSVEGCLPESTITTAVRITKAVNVYSYELYVTYDTASLQFVSGRIGNDANPNLLEKNGDAPSFMAKRSIDSTSILVACWLLGEVSECPAGNGVMGLLTFKHKKHDTTELSIGSHTFLDCDENSDTELEVHSGKITPSQSPVIFHPGRRTTLPDFVVRNGKLEVSFPRSTAYTLTAVNPMGRMLYSAKGFSDIVRFDRSSIKGDSNGFSGLMIVRICYAGGREFVVPLL